MFVRVLLFPLKHLVTGRELKHRWADQAWQSFVFFFLLLAFYKSFYWLWSVYPCNILVKPYWATQRSHAVTTTVRNIFIPSQIRIKHTLPCNTKSNLLHLKVLHLNWHPTNKQSADWANHRLQRLRKAGPSSLDVCLALEAREFFGGYNPLAIKILINTQVKMSKNLVLSYEVCSVLSQEQIPNNLYKRKLHIPKCSSFSVSFTAFLWFKAARHCQS